MAQARQRRKVGQEGQEEGILTSHLLPELLAQEYSELADGTMADLFAGRTGVVSESSEAYSENGGKPFVRYLTRKHEAEITDYAH